MEELCVQMSTSRHAEFPLQLEGQVHGIKFQERFAIRIT